MVRRLFWTPERIDQIRAFYNLEWTSEQMAAHFGVSVGAVRRIAYQNKVTSRERHAFIQSRRMKGRKDSAETRQRKSEAMRRKHADPIVGAKLRAVGALACKRADREKAAATRRGFAIPTDKRDEYFGLRRKHLSAREAGAVLGLIPQQQATGGL